MELFFELSGYLSILLSGLSLTAQSMVVGGVGFLLIAVRPLEQSLSFEGQEIQRNCQKLLAWTALAFVLLSPARIGLQLVILLGTTSVQIEQAFQSWFVISLLLQAGAGAILFAVSRDPERKPAAATMILLAVGILTGNVATSHAAGRLEDGAFLLGVTTIHALGAALWVGGLPFLLIGLRRLEDGRAIGVLGRRYSAISIFGVSAILGSGLAMGIFYIGSFEAIYGTAYGLMTGVKAILLGMLLLLGGMNFLLAKGLRHDPDRPTLQFRRFVEAELGIGLTVFFAAASLMGVPPGVELPDDRVTMTEIVERVWPVRPRFESPEHAGLALVALQNSLNAEAVRTASTAGRAFVPGLGEVPVRNAQDIAWSEYNHNWAGVLVLMIGLLAMAERAGWRPGRHWPLLFLVMAAFLFLRSDPEVWPLGPIGFFESLRDAEVAQHRVYVLVIILFGVFEWMVRTGRWRNPNAALAFPILCAFGGALLLTHNHAISNVKEALLVEISHALIGLIGVAAGWSRWIEVRTPGRPARIASWLWPICFVLIGLVLIDYRESSGSATRVEAQAPTRPE